MKSLYDVLAPEDRLDSSAPDELETSPLVTESNAKEFALGILQSPEYRRSLLRRIVTDELAPAVECKLIDLAFGKKFLSLEKDAIEDLSKLTNAEIKERALRLAQFVELAKEKESSDDEDEPTPTVN